MLESDILHTAIENLKKLTQAQIEIIMPQISNGHQQAILDIHLGTTVGRFKVAVKGNVLPSNLPGWVDNLR